MGRSIDRLREHELGEAFVKRGGRRDRRQLFLGQEIGMRDPPVPSAASANRNRSLDPEQVTNDVEASDDWTSGAAGDRRKGRSRRSCATMHPTEARLSGAGEGFYQQFP